MEAGKEKEKSRSRGTYVLIVVLVLMIAGVALFYSASSLSHSSFSSRSQPASLQASPSSPYHPDTYTTPQLGTSSTPDSPAPSPSPSPSASPPPPTSTPLAAVVEETVKDSDTVGSVTVGRMSLCPSSSCSRVSYHELVVAVRDSMSGGVAGRCFEGNRCYGVHNISSPCASPKPAHPVGMGMLVFGHERPNRLDKLAQQYFFRHPTGNVSYQEPYWQFPSSSPLINILYQAEGHQKTNKSRTEGYHDSESKREDMDDGYVFLNGSMWATSSSGRREFRYSCKEAVCACQNRSLNTNQHSSLSNTIGSNSESGINSLKWRWLNGEAARAAAENSVIWILGDSQSRHMKDAMGHLLSGAGPICGDLKANDIPKDTNCGLQSMSYIYDSNTWLAVQRTFFMTDPTKRYPDAVAKFPRINHTESALTARLADALTLIGIPVYDPFPEHTNASYTSRANYEKRNKLKTQPTYIPLPPPSLLPSLALDSSYEAHLAKRMHAALERNLTHIHLIIFIGAWDAKYSGTGEGKDLKVYGSHVDRVTKALDRLTRQVRAATTLLHKAYIHRYLNRTSPRSSFTSPTSVLVPRMRVNVFYIEHGTVSSTARLSNDAWVAHTRSRFDFLHERFGQYLKQRSVADTGMVPILPLDLQRIVDRNGANCHFLVDGFHYSDPVHHTLSHHILNAIHTLKQHTQQCVIHPT